MRILLISIALLAGVIAGAASAGVKPRSEPRAADTPSVAAMRALVTRCLPGVAGDNRIVTTGFARLDTASERNMLGTRTGAIWQKQDGRVLLIDFADAPVCRVVVASIDPAILADLVISLFREEDGHFRRERFSFRADGGFAAVYATTGESAGVVVRISTEKMASGRALGSMTVERTLP